jgi:hypothetical protein
MLNTTPETAVADRQTKRTFLSYAVTTDRSSRRGWLCAVTDDRGVVSYTHHNTKTAALSWGNGLIRG